MPRARHQSSMQVPLPCPPARDSGPPSWTSTVSSGLHLDSSPSGWRGRIEYMHKYGTGEAIPIVAAAAEQAQHRAMALTGGVQQPLPHGQLTLSFQGEVFVLENVSVEKVQAVLLLLGGRELPPGSVPVPSSSSSPYIKAMNFSHRMESLIRFRQKRKERNFDKKIRYSVRKEVAHRMQRHKGQFTSSKAKAEEAKSAGATSDGSTNQASVEDQPQYAYLFWRTRWASFPCRCEKL